MQRGLCICLLLSACATGGPLSHNRQVRADRRVSRRVIGDDGVKVCLLMEKVMDPSLRSVHLQLHVDADRRVVAYEVQGRPYLAACVDRALNASRLPLPANGSGDDYDVAVALRVPQPARPAVAPPPLKTASAR